MGNMRYYKDISNDSLAEFYLHGISGGSGEQKLYSSEGFADNELNHPSPEIRKTPEQKVCYRCKVVLDTRSRCCRNCYQTRKEWMPPRPTRRLRKREFSLISSDEEKIIPAPPLSKCSNLGRMRLEKRFKEDSFSSDDSTASEFAAERKKERLKRRGYIRKIMDKAYDTTASSSLDDVLCMACHIRPLEAVLVHEKTAHLCVCKKCAATLDYKKERCPACGKKIHYYLTGYTQSKKLK